MGKLVLLIAMALAGAAGWFGGGWSGRHAVAELAEAKALGKQSREAHDEIVKGLNQKLAGMGSDFAQDQKKRDDAHVKSQAELSGLLGQRDQRIAELGRVKGSTQTRLVSLRQAAAAPGVSPELHAQQIAQIAQLEKTVIDQQIMIQGFECTKIAVPADLLAVFRAGQP